jgi:hypothetical protein
MFLRLRRASVMMQPRKIGTVAIVPTHDSDFRTVAADRTQGTTIRHPREH